MEFHFFVFCSLEIVLYQPVLKGDDWLNSLEFFTRLVKIKEMNYFGIIFKEIDIYCFPDLLHPI
jgi:hypothetical protein